MDEDISVELLRAEGLCKHFPVRDSAGKRSLLRAVDRVDLFIRRGSTFGIVGESGSGKSTLGQMLVGLLRPTAGRIVYDNYEVDETSRKMRRRISREIQLIFQDPFSSLNPRMTVGDIVAEPLAIHGIGDRGERFRRVAELLDLVGLDPSHHRRRPGSFSGGQRQRIGIARALALNPRLLVLDEPVSALDVSVQAQVLNLLVSLQRELGLTYVFISHDLSVVRQICDEIAVMYLGRIMEQGPWEQIFETPRHPYTAALLSAAPRLRTRATNRIMLQGDIPSPINPPSGCVFRTRCFKAEERCSVEVPSLAELGTTAHSFACHFPLVEEPL